MGLGKLSNMPKVTETEPLKQVTVCEYSGMKYYATLLHFLCVLSHYIGSRFWFSLQMICGWPTMTWSQPLFASTNLRSPWSTRVKFISSCGRVVQWGPLPCVLTVCLTCVHRQFLRQQHLSFVHHRLLQPCWYLQQIFHRSPGTSCWELIRTLKTNQDNRQLFSPSGLQL